PARKRGTSDSRSAAEIVSDGPRLELKSRRELDRSWSADLVQGTEAAVCCTSAETVGERPGGVTERRRGQIVLGAAEIRLVEDMEALAAQAKPEACGRPELTLQRDVGLRRAESAKDIAAEVPLLTVRGRSERGPVEDFSPGVLRPEQFKRHPGVHIRPRAQGN